MFILGSRKPRKKDRSRSNKLTAKHKAKNRRRVNGMIGKKQGQK
jgi:hypothetical protein